MDHVLDTGGARTRVDDIADALSLDEKAAFTAGRDNWSTVAVERLGIPSLRVTDGPNGARGLALFGAGEQRAVCVPCGTALAATWDPALVERRSEEHTSELQSRQYLVCRLLLEKKK